MKKECKFKMNKAQLETLVFILESGIAWGDDKIEQALLWSIFQKIIEKIQIKLIKASKPLYGLTFDTTESLAILLYLRWLSADAKPETYHGILIINMHTHISSTFNL